MEAMLAAVEQACRELQHPATQRSAEATLLQFRSSPGPIPSCRFVLTHSHSIDAQFHAAAALRDCLGREWANIQQQQGFAEDLQSFLLQTAVRLLAEPAGQVVRSTLVAALALLTKRGWLGQSQETRRGFFQGLQSTVDASGSAAAQRLGVEVMTALVGEFSLSSATPLGMAWELHEACCRDLEEGYLRNIFGHANHLGKQAAESGAAASGADAGACAASLTLLGVVLGWDFQRPLIRNAAAMAHQARPSSSSGAASSAPSAPQSSWGELLLSPSTTSWLVQLLESLSAQQLANAAAAASANGLGHASPQARHAVTSQQRHVSSLAAQARQLLVTFCSFKGEDVFPKEWHSAGPSPLRLGYLSQMLSGVLRWVLPVDGQMQKAMQEMDEGGPLVDACRAIAVLAPTHRAMGLDAACAQVLGPTGPTFVNVLQQLTHAMVAASTAAAIASGGAGCDVEWLTECTDMLVEAWCALVAPDYSRGATSIPAAAAHAASTVFLDLMGFALNEAAAGAHQDAVDADEDAASAVLEDYMSRLATLARAAPQLSFPHLTQQIEERRQLLLSASTGRGTGGADMDVVQEQLVWLLRMAAHCLADSGAGETPLVPLSVSSAVEAGNGVDQVVIALCGAMIAVPALVLEGQSGGASPRLMEVGVWCLARWADTYLFPEDNLPQALHAAYATAGGPAMQVLNQVAAVANRCLVAFAGEAELHKQVCTALLPVLVRRKVLSEQLMPLQPWQELCQAFAQRQPVLTAGLGAKIQRSLAQDLCQAAAGIPDSDEAQRYVGSLMQRCCQEIAALASSPELNVLGERADVAGQLCSLLECLRGAQRATLSTTQPALWVMCEGLLESLLLLYGAFTAHSGVVVLLLKLACDIVEHHVSLVRPSQVNTLMRWVLQLFERYGKAKVGVVALPPSSSRARADLTAAAAAGRLAEQRHGESARELRVLLRLLIHVTQRELAEGDGGAEDKSNHVDISQVVLLGLDTLMPLMTPEMLSFPKVLSLHFSLLSFMLEQHPATAVGLPPSRVAMLASSLQHGLLHSDNAVCSSSLEGLAGLAKHHFECLQCGAPGWSAHTMTGAQGSPVPLVPHFLELLLRKLLLDDTPCELVETAADCMLPLLLSDLATYRQLCTSLVQAQVDPHKASRISAALHSLLPSESPPGQQVHHAHHAGSEPAPASLGFDLSRNNRRVFRARLISAVADVRGLMSIR